MRDRLGRQGGYARCVVSECDQPTMAHQAKGLNRNYCRRHVDHYGRHGSYSKPSYIASALNPYRKSAYEWLLANDHLIEVREARDRVRTLYWRAGRATEAFRLAGGSPKERASYVWGRLSQRKVDPSQVLATCLAVAMIHAVDVQPERRAEFRRVQVAKVLHRLAGGSHKRWEHQVEDRLEVTELHKYPQSRGLVLRHVGRASAWAAEPLVRYLEDLSHAHLKNTPKGTRLARMRQGGESPV